MLLFFFILIGAGGYEWLTLSRKPSCVALKREVVKIITLPDLALSTEAHCIRHRSITTLYEVFGFGPALLPYFPSEFVYAPPPYLHADQEMR